MDTTQDTRMPLVSHNIVAERIDALRELFPEVFAEGEIDFAKLKQALGDFTSDSPERYGLSWAGKSEAIRAVQSLSSGTLVPCKEESVNFDTTENLIIEGDNLEVLKLLQKSYFGKVKMIYIDPPYNTGYDFIYPDNFNDGLRAYLEYTGQITDGIRQETDIETSGRFHSRWLSMMYPRLFLARNLLAEDGAIFISIDENELHNLIVLCNEIFGEENFVECMVYDKKAAPKGVPPVNMIVGVHEYIVCYSRTGAFSFVGTPRSTDGFSNPDNDPRGIWRNTNLRSTVKDKSEAFTITDPATGRTYTDTWAHSKEEIDRLIAEKRMLFPSSSDGQVRKKEFYYEFKNENIPVKSSLGLYDAQVNTEMLTKLMGGKFFLNAKSEKLIRDVIGFTTSPGDTILDFFSGSCTTAHAVLNLNKEGGARKFIMVQIPEPCDENSEAYTAGYRTIADIGKERVRRAIAEINRQNGGQLQLDDSIAQDWGFKVFKLTSSNFKLWNADEAPKDAEALAEQLKLYADHIVEGRSQEDILYELLLKAGLPLTAKIEEREVNGQRAFSIADGLLLICLEDEISQETLRGMIELKPEMVLCLDNAFKGNDQLKTNIVLEMESHEIKFHTV